MIPLSDEEEEVFRLGLLINARGLAIDRESAEAALLLADRAKARFDAANVQRHRLAPCGAARRRARSTAGSTAKGSRWTPPPRPTWSSFSTSTCRHT